MGVPAPHSSNINEPNEIHDGVELRITETMRSSLSAASSRENSASPCLEDPCFDGMDGNDFDLDLDGPNVVNVDWIGGSGSWEDSTEGLDAFPNNAADDLEGIFEPPDLSEGSSPTNTNTNTNLDSNTHTKPPHHTGSTGCTVEEFPAPPVRAACTPGPCPSAAPPSPAGWGGGWGKSTPCSDAGSEGGCSASVMGEEGVGTSVWLIEAARHRVEVSTSTGGKKLGRSFGMEFPTLIHPATTYKVAVFLSQASPYAARRLPACMACLELYSVDGTPLHNLTSLEPKEMVGDERELFCELQVKMDKQVIKTFGAGRVPQMYLRMNIKTCAGRDVLATATSPLFKLEKRTRTGRPGRAGASPSPAMTSQHPSPCPSGFSMPSHFSPSPAPSCASLGAQEGGEWCPASPRDAAPRKRSRRSMEMEGRHHPAPPEGSSSNLESLLTTVEKMEVQMLLRSVEKMTPLQRSYFQQQLSLMDRVSTDVRRT